jgi:hypothetical protein
MEKLTGTIKEGTAASGLSARKIYDHLARGDFASITDGRRRLIVWESFERFLLGKVTGYAPVASIRRRNRGSVSPSPRVNPPVSDEGSHAR